MTYKNYADLPLALTVKQVSEILGIGQNTAYCLVRSGQIKSIRYRITKTALRDYLERSAA